MVVTKVAIDCLKIINTHLIELECFEVKGAAKQASPTFISSYCNNPNIPPLPN